MNKNRKSLLISLAVVTVMLTLLLQSLATAQTEASSFAPVNQDEEPKEPPAGPPVARAAPQAAASVAAPASKPEIDSAAAERALAKLHSDLRQLAQSSGPALRAGLGPETAGGAAPEPIFIQVVAYVPSSRSGDFDMSGYFVDGQVFARPPLAFGNSLMQMYFGRAMPGSLIKIAELGQVQALLPVVLERNGTLDDYPIQDPVEFPEKTMADWSRLRNEADALRAGLLPWDQARAFGDGRPYPLRPSSPEDWFEVMPEGPHKASVAWERGYRGEGVTVAVIDEGVDPAHPDLMGTQKIYSSIIRPEYNGWPVVFSPFSQFLYANDVFLGTTYVADGFPGIHLVDTSNGPATTPCGSGISCFNYTPLIDYGVPNPFAPPGGYTFVISDTMSQSGAVHVGTHPDNDLRDYIWGEKVAVLVVDANSSGVYDTVYVDMDADHDFRDEKPLTRADVGDLANTRNNMIAYRDMNGDGLADISGGMLYFIANGVDPIPASDWVWGLPAPANGDLVAFSGGTFDRPYSHGTQCASNIVGQGVTNAFLPDFSDLAGPAPLAPTGRPSGAVFGTAPGAELVNISDIGWNFESSVIDAYIVAALGYDGLTVSGDEVQIASNSYGRSDIDNDGWDYRGQVVSLIQEWYGPNMQFLFSTGNGAPAYGTVAPPSPATGIGVGASTQFGSTGWDSITHTYQIMNNDVTPFSNRGPGARGTNGTDVVAGGAFAAGAEELNYYSVSTWGAPNGNQSWDSWGGTSRSAPVASGVLALLYQAYYEANGAWPTHEVAKALLMSSATDLNYDAFSQGSGSVNADRGTAVAGGHYGVYVDGSGSTWQPGDYRGADYPGFAHLAYPGDVFSRSFSVSNTGVETVTVSIDDAELLLLDSVEFDFTVTPAMVADEEDNFLKAFNYFIPITATAGMGDPSWYNIDVPADADLMIVRQRFPFDQYDDGDYSWDNRFFLAVYNWEDVNGDGNVWEDLDGNGVVDFVNGSGPSNQADGAIELDWDNPATELDRWEFGRFSYHRPGGNRNEMWVHDPLDRMIDGLFIGLYHNPNSTFTGTTTLSYRIEFYREEDVTWLSQSGASLEIAPGTAANFVATASVPSDMPPGMYEAAIQISDPGWMTYTADTSIIPVVLNVGAVFSEGMTLGGYDSYNYDADRPYNNAAVRGLFDWTWRPESGDWRFFFVDVQNEQATLLSEDFEGAFPPAGWTVITNTGAGWNTNTFWGAANVTNGSGQSADADSDAFGGGMNTELWSPPIDLSGTLAPALAYESNFQDFAGDGDAWLDISTDGGASWSNLTYWTEDYGPTSELIDLSAYAGSTIMLRWHYDDNGGWAWYWQIDDVRVFDRVYGSGTQIIAKDEWDDAAPHTDIDTIVLGPSSTSLGTGWYDFPDPAFFGPYVLDTVAKSPNTYIGSGTWLFDTSSGGNEEWVSFGVQDGLHEIMQHNVLFEGDKFDVVFTKTVGTLTEDVHDFYLETYVDDGTVGTVNLSTSLPINEFVAQGVMTEIEANSWLNEPIDFVDSNTIEWTYAFVTNNTLEITAWTSSATISDIDLYLFYLGPTGVETFEQRDASTTATADEIVQVADPEDGVWLIGINNWSGPAGDFNLWLELLQSSDAQLTVTGPAGAIAAGETFSLTIAYSLPAGAETPRTYQGTVYGGPSGAPQLKAIPLTIVRLPESAGVDKTADFDVNFPGNEANFFVDLFNFSDRGATFAFSDPIPDGSTFVTATLTGLPDPIPVMCDLNEGFEGASFPPDGWRVLVNSGAGWNTNTFWGSANLTPGADGQSADADSNAFGAGMDTELWSTWVDLTTATVVSLTFESNFQDFNGNGDAWVDVSSDGGLTWNNEFSETNDEPTSGITHTLDLSAYAGETIVLRWHFATPAWDWYWQIDDVSLIRDGACTPYPFDPFGAIVYDSVNDEITYDGLLPLSEFQPGVEDFEHGGDFPPGWVVQTLEGAAWGILNNATFGGDSTLEQYSAFMWWVDVDGVPTDSWLYSTEFDVTADDNWTSFMARSDTLFPDATVSLYAIDASGTFTDVIWNQHMDETWSTFDWWPVTVDLSAYEGETIKLAWRYLGQDGESFALDHVRLPGMEDVWLPAATVELTVRLDDALQTGDWVTNTATMIATHETAQGAQVEPAVWDDAAVRIGGPELATSHKTASAEAATGGLITYEIHVINGGDQLTVATVTDAIPTGTTFDSLDGPPPVNFNYDAVMDQVEWTGNVAPGEEVVLTFRVAVDNDSALWGDTITNTATIAWDSSTLEVSASTVIVPTAQLYLPVVAKP